ncbi:25884_t:CDS:1, partial [Racocetra persica]
IRTSWEGLNLLHIIELDNIAFQNLDETLQNIENLDNENELNSFIQDLESEENYNPSELAQKYFEDFDIF